MNIGTEFEEELSKEFGIAQVSGSGNQWHSKLDLSGRGAKWSLKATSKKSLSISQSIIDEAVHACEAVGGDGTIPIWAFRIGEEKYDIIAMRKEDFKLLQQGDVQIISDPVSDQVMQRRVKASKPSLLRDE